MSDFPTLDFAEIFPFSTLKSFSGIVDSEGSDLLHSEPQLLPPGS